MPADPVTQEARASRNMSASEPIARTEPGVLCITRPTFADFLLAFTSRNFGLCRRFGASRLARTICGTAARAHFALRQIEDAGAMASLRHLEQRAAAGLLHIVAVRGDGQNIERGAHFFLSTRKCARSLRVWARAPNESRRHRCLRSWANSANWTKPCCPMPASRTFRPTENSASPGSMRSCSSTSRPRSSGGWRHA